MDANTREWGGQITMWFRAVVHIGVHLRLFAVLHLNSHNLSQYLLTGQAKGRIFPTMKPELAVKLAGETVSLSPKVGQNSSFSSPMSCRHPPRWAPAAVCLVFLGWALRILADDVTLCYADPTFYACHGNAVNIGATIEFTHDSV
jgi:hypothetical protein